jgi:Fe-S-cluster containining protein
MECDEAEEEPCGQCGLCCKIFGDSIAPTAMNLFCWLENGRYDILRYFSACMPDGAWINCAYLKPEDLGDNAAVELRDPVTMGHLSACPFLRRIAKRRYVCGIHDTKPEMCGNYRPWIWGETYFNRCKALENIERKSRWRL